MSELGIFKTPDKSYIKLFGLIGTFSTPNANLKVRFFSTFASKKEVGSGPHELLKELKPMRERVESSKIMDMGSLMQRDLNDSRVANDLVPYLLGTKNDSQVAFFPAILAVLMPKDKIYEVNNIDYPKASIPVESKLEFKIGSETYWRLEQPNQAVPLGILEISSHFVDIIVIDGQHRANAFRLATQEFFEGKINDIYKPFYSPVNEVIKSMKGKIDSDLPVTLIWFENDTKVEPTNTIDPKVISRRLFVDVNNNAKKVNNSRNILLDDYDPSKVFTRSVYSSLASNSSSAKYGSFSPERFSLLHSGFDVDDDLQYSKPHIFTLTVPEIIKTIVDWVFFSTRYHAITGRSEVKRSTRRKYLTFAKELLPLTGQKLGFKDSIEEEVFFRHDELKKDSEVVSKEIETCISNPITAFFNGFSLLQPHYQACSIIFEMKGKEGDSHRKQILEEVFAGGEGLFYSIKNTPKSQKNIEIKNYLDIIDSIQSDFSKEREKQFNSNPEVGSIEEKRIIRAFETFRTKAFQTGMFMNFWVTFHGQIVSLKSSPTDAMTQFLDSINKIGPSGWVWVLTEYAPRFVNSALDPKKWPAFQTIVSRVSQPESMPENQNPDLEVFMNILQEKTEALIKPLGLTMKDPKISSYLDDQKRGEIFSQAEQEFNELLGKCKLTRSDRLDCALIAESYFGSASPPQPEDEDTEED